MLLCLKVPFTPICIVLYFEYIFFLAKLNESCKLYVIYLLVVILGIFLLTTVHCLSLIDLVLNLLISEDRLPLDQRDLLFDVLLRRHVHLHERLRPKLIGRSATNLPLIRSLADIGKRHSAKDVEKGNNTKLLFSIEIY